MEKQISYVHLFEFRQNEMYRQLLNNQVQILDQLFFLIPEIDHTSLWQQ